MLPRIPSSLLALLLLLLSTTTRTQHVLADATPTPEDQLTSFFPPTQTHTNNWAVLVCASRYWFNYRHMANTLGMYRTVKRLGIPDSNIILMLADDVACNARNRFPATVFANKDRRLDLYGEDIEVDYRGYEVTVENFIRLLTGRVSPTLPRSKRLLTDSRSNIFLYLTGHGGSEFLKFQDNEEISAFDIADAIAQMWEKRRYNEMLLMVDTCQANTMYGRVYSPGVVATGSSEEGENSYSHHNDPDIGVAVIDSFTHYILQYMEGQNKTSKATLQDLFETYDPALIKSHAGVRSDLFTRPLDKVRITDFLGAVSVVDGVPSEETEMMGVGGAEEAGMMETGTETAEADEVKVLYEQASAAGADEQVQEHDVPMPGPEGRKEARSERVVLNPLPTAADGLYSLNEPLRGSLLGVGGGPTLRAWGAAGVVLGLVAWRVVLS